MARYDADLGVAAICVAGADEAFTLRRALIEKRWRELRRSPSARAWGGLHREAEIDVDALLRKQRLA